MVKDLSKFSENSGSKSFAIKGSHHFLKHFDGRATVVPVHGNENIGIGLFYKILKDCEITVEELLNENK